METNSINTTKRGYAVYKNGALQTSALMKRSENPKTLPMNGGGIGMTGSLTST